MTPYEIRKVGCSEVLGAPNAEKMLADYAAECLMPGAIPQAHIYEAMEEAGLITCFGAYALLRHALDSEELVGFVTVVSTVAPHNGKRVAAVESIYLDPEHRGSPLGVELIEAAAGFARDAGCALLTFTAREGSALEAVLSHRKSCTRTHVNFTEWF